MQPWEGREGGGEGGEGRRRGGGGEGKGGGGKGEYYIYDVYDITFTG